LVPTNGRVEMDVADPPPRNRTADSPAMPNAGYWHVVDVSRLAGQLVEPIHARNVNPDRHKTNPPDAMPASAESSISGFPRRGAIRPARDASRHRPKADR